ncbi:MAG: hypothetical protein O2999_08070 [Nitrospirae bacterium]|nr:hypothetical protein [Nitrospirota bacterium]MDA1304243.1 hypothetical protein [Nitrospirota bacterium]
MKRHLPQCIKAPRPWKKSRVVFPLLLGMLLAPVPYLLAQVVEVPIIPGSLKEHMVVQQDGTRTAPLASGLKHFLISGPKGLKYKQAVQVGKALYWDQQLGSDGVACASCHFHAGVDSRFKNQMHPGPNNEFEFMKNGEQNGPNFTAKREHFEFDTSLSSDDIMGSHGVPWRQLDSSTAPLEFEKTKFAQTEVCATDVDNVWHVTGLNVRRATGRNTPAVTNAIFNFDNFWDGRAKWTFNGKTPVGNRDNVKIEVWDGSNTSEVKMKEIDSNMLHPGSVFSQADGPPLSDTEMSCIGRTFTQIGKKMLGLRALQLQEVHKQDNALGGLRHPSGLGLKETYKQLIQSVFKKEYWGDNSYDANGYTQMERNFPLFFGILVGLYEATLVTDDTPFDQWNDKGRPKNGVSGFGKDEEKGLSVFMNEGKCVNCHSTAMFTRASTLYLGDSNNSLVERMSMRDGSKAVYDGGFYNIGVRPTKEDLGRGASDFSFTKQYIEKLLGNKVPDHFSVDPCKFENPWKASDFPYAAAAGHLTVHQCEGHPAEGDIPATPPYETVVPDKGPKSLEEIEEIKKIKLAVDGSFKVPTLRNVWLTGPYFHNSGKRTLEEVIEFYNRGGDFGTDTNPEKDPDIRPLGLSKDMKADLLAFLKSLTDQRSVNESGVFSHPQLWIPDGHKEDQWTVFDDNWGKATDDFKEIPAVGKHGRSKLRTQGLKGLYPLGHFLGKPGDINSDGSTDLLDQIYILFSLGKKTEIYNDLRDLNHDGVINFEDMKELKNYCDKPGCRVSGL